MKRSPQPKSLLVYKSAGIAVMFPFFLGTVGFAQPTLAPTPTPLPSFRDFINKGSGAVHASRKDISVTISSNLENSYKKLDLRNVAGPVLLPDYCYLRDSNGAFVLSSTGQRILDIGPNRPVRWAAPITGLYSIQCMRNLDGSMDIHAVATTGNSTLLPNSPINSYWTQGNLTANAAGFITPKYKWEFSGAPRVARAANGVVSYRDDSDPHIKEGQDNSFNLALTISSPGYSGYEISPVYPSVDANNNLVAATSLPASSIKVIATETDVASPAYVIENKYNINWHVPLENNIPLQNDTYQWVYDESSSEWTGIGGGMNVTVRPGNAGWSIANGGFTVASAGVGVWLGATATPIPIGNVLLITLALTAAGMAISSEEPIANTVPVIIDYTHYRKAMKHQLQFLAGNPNEPDHQSVFPSQWENFSKYANELNDDVDATGDANFNLIKDDMKVKIIQVRKRTIKHFQGDLYDSNGFKETQNHITFKDGANTYLPIIKVGTAGPTPAPYPTPTPTPPPPPVS